MSAPAMLPFSLEGRELLVDASLVREVLGEVAAIQIPLADRDIPGVFLWNGQAVPLLDLNHCLGLNTAHSYVKMPRTIVSRVNGELVGLGVHELSEIVSIAEAEMKPPRVHELPFASAEVERANTVSTVLDLPKLVAHVMHIKSVE